MKTLLWMSILNYFVINILSVSVSNVNSVNAVTDLNVTDSNWWLVNLFDWFMLKSHLLVLWIKLQRSCCKFVLCAFERRQHNRNMLSVRTAKLGKRNILEKNWYLHLIMQVPPLPIKTFLCFAVVSHHLCAVYAKAGRELLETDVCSDPCWFFRLSREATWSDQISAYMLSLTGHAHTLRSESDDPSAGWAYSNGF